MKMQAFDKMKLFVKEAEIHNKQVRHLFIKNKLPIPRVGKRYGECLVRSLKLLSNKPKAFEEYKNLRKEFTEYYSKLSC